MAERPRALGAASRLLGVDPDTLRRWADASRIPSFQTPGGHRRFRRQDVERLTRARRAERVTAAGLGATSQRIAQAYRRTYRANRDSMAGPVLSSYRPKERSSDTTSTLL